MKRDAIVGVNRSKPLVNIDQFNVHITPGHEKMGEGVSSLPPDLRTIG
jgi:hypothetical protein